MVVGEQGDEWYVLSNQFSTFLNYCHISLAFFTRARVERHFPPFLGNAEGSWLVTVGPSHVHHQFFRNVHRRQDHRSSPLFPLHGDVGPNWYHIVVVSIIWRERSCIQGGDSK